MFHMLYARYNGPLTHIASSIDLTKSVTRRQGDGLYKLEASDQILIVHSVYLYVIVFRNKYCLN